MKSTLLIAIVAAAGVALSFLLRTTMTRTVGLTMTGPKMTHFVASNTLHGTHGYVVLHPNWTVKPRCKSRSMAKDRA